MTTDSLAILRPIEIETDHIAFGDCVLYDGDWLLVEKAEPGSVTHHGTEIVVRCQPLLRHGDDNALVFYTFTGKKILAFPLWMRAQVQEQGRADPAAIMAKLLREHAAKLMLETKPGPDAG